MFRDAREHQRPQSISPLPTTRVGRSCLETLAVGRGYVAADELAVGHALCPAKALPRAVLRAEDVAAASRRGSYERPATRRRLFKPGRPRADQEHASEDAHAPSTLRARAGWEWSSACSVVRSFPTVRRSGAATTGWLYVVVFQGANCGATMPTRRSRSPSTLSSLIWSACDDRGRPDARMAARASRLTERPRISRGVGGAGFRARAGAA